MDHVRKVINAFGRHAAEPLEKETRESVAGALEAMLNIGHVVSSSLCGPADGLIGIVDTDRAPKLLAVSEASGIPLWLTTFEGESTETRGLRVLTAGMDTKNADALKKLVPYTRPQPLGLDPSFGFGDRIGLATSGHALAMIDAKEKIRPIFAQQSIREMSRTGRTARQVMDDAVWGVFRAGWRYPFGADADHLKVEADVETTAREGFTFFTIDPSQYVEQRIDAYAPNQIEEKFRNLVDSRVHGMPDLVKRYRGETFKIDGEDETIRVNFDDLSLKRAVVKYGRALAHTYEMAHWVAKAMGASAYELEISVDETPQPTSVLEHLLIALELKRHKIPIVSIAPRFVGEFEKGIDYKGDISFFERSLTRHAAIAGQFGPYKIGVHSGSDKFGIYPCIGRICKGRFHVKTAGTSYLEALRAVCRIDKDFFRSIITFARDRFEADRASYHLSSGTDRVPEAGELEDEELESTYLDQNHGRQILHVTFGSILTAEEDNQYRFREKIRTLLRQSRNLHEELLRNHLGKHVKMLLNF
jgi:tagaturonate epimerase